MKRIAAFLSLTLVLSACNTERPVTESGSVISTRSTAQGSVSLQDQMVTADVVHHTFSDGNQITLYRLGDTFFAEGSDIGYAPARELATTISQLEVNHAQKLKGQQAGMQPGQQVDGVPVVWPSGVDRGLLYYDVGGFPGNAGVAVAAGIEQWNNSGVKVKLKNMRPTSDNGNIFEPIYKYFTIIGNASSFGSPVVAWMKTKSCHEVSGFTSNIGYAAAGGNNSPIAATIYINPDCFNYPNFDLKTVIQHEIGHVAGLYHEMSYCGRSNFINVSYTSPPAWYDIPAQQNAGEVCDSPYYGNIGYYDFDSLMHYPYDSYSYMSTTVTFGRKDNITNPNYCGNRFSPGYATGLSPRDIKAINYMYGKGPAPVGCN